ncbi:glycerol-3-phosphate acyltransferase [Colwellia chukchiensis]|uniref:Glycerol-3-phosphate acyltransferase n=1 Tax=Colwellia chukchiensis TaxID=641665 RepID=A0A1H7QQV0_9GAMM|nr:glycerol-3-phosphate 1-O-acyltransferase PlsB [Colwellia chukchiensis]SEL50088.1 glycerol-3-phosphate acyltransferase [Colwellia chukchiensis]
MLAIRKFFYLLLRLPVALLVRCRVVADEKISNGQLNAEQPVFYVLRHQSASDVLSLRIACKKAQLPDPLSPVEVDGQTRSRLLFLAKPTALLQWRKTAKTSAIAQGFELLSAHASNEQLDAQLIPANVIWGRTPTKEKNNTNVGTLLADQESPTWLRKFFIVLFLGRHTMVRFSEAISFRQMADQHGSNEASARKLMRIARFHFHRQTIAATGPRLMHRQQMFKNLLVNPAIQRVINEEIKNKNISEAEAKKQALAIMDEIAGDYRDVTVRLGERILGWLWKRLYRDIKVNQAERLRNLAQEGHEIIYLPCHRSHMDYLLLTYVIYQQGLVTPRIAAGINLNFWPAGPIFRKAGAFFIRRSFKGNRLYSTIFREYLSLLFERGYSVKYYAEGGRSRTGRLLTPKTGMLAMTIQSLLRGINRPLTIVPVYLGYEHVMEVGTYHKELSGSQKKGESIVGVIKAIRSLRNYGNGYVNFGEPININQFLNQDVPDWKQAIDPIDPQKPSWLNPSVNKLAQQVMTNINQCAALNGVALVALILHATENKALSKIELIEQIDFFLALQHAAPYHNELTLPSESGAAILEHVISLDKLTVNQDSLGEIISLTDSAVLELRYYRNNILHTFIVPSLVCRFLERNAKVAETALISQIQRLVQLLKSDMFLWQNDDIVAQQTLAICHHLQQHNIAKQSKSGFWSLCAEDDKRAKVRLVAECVNETMQRVAIISSLLTQLAPIKKSSLDEKVLVIAQRLSVLNNISAPEFIDKKAQSTLIAAMREQGYIDLDDNGQLVASNSLSQLRASISNLVEIEVLQSIIP